MKAGFLLLMASHVSATVEKQDERGETDPGDDEGHESSTVSGATSARSSSGRCGFGCL